MKILTLTILASLSLGAVALPSAVVYEVPGSEYREQVIYIDRDDKVIYIDTADSSDDLDVRALDATPLDEQTLIQINGLPDEPKNRDFDEDMRRTYNQRDNIESDYGKEIELEIIDDRDKWD